MRRLVLSVLLILAACKNVHTSTTVRTTLPPHPPGACLWDGEWYNDGEVIERSSHGACETGVLCEGGSVIVWDGAGCFGFGTPEPQSPSRTTDEAFTTDYTDQTMESDLTEEYEPVTKQSGCLKDGVLHSEGTRVEFQKGPCRMTGTCEGGKITGLKSEGDCEQASDNESLVRDDGRGDSANLSQSLILLFTTYMFHMLTVEDVM